MKHRNFIIPPIAIFIIMNLVLVMSMLNGNNTSAIAIGIVTVVMFYLAHILDIAIMVNKFYKNKSANLLATLLCVVSYTLCLMLSRGANDILQTVLYCGCVVSFWFSVTYMKRLRYTALKVKQEVLDVNK